MTNNKKHKKEKKEPTLSKYKTKEERQEQVKTIISELNKLDLTIQYEPIKELYACFKKYTDEGICIKVNIPFPAMRLTIVGELKVGEKEECVVCLQQDKANTKIR